MISDLPVQDLIPVLSPELRSPHHLTEWCSAIERAAAGEPLRAINAEPIRHYKTTTTNHGVIRILLRDPTTPVIHLSASFERAQAVGKKIRQLAEAADHLGAKIGPSRGQNTIVDWRNDAGGGVVVMSADQSKLGYDCGCLVFDDPIDEFGAEDPKKRDAVDEAIAHYTARCMRNGKPGPVLGVMSRWHPDDPAGRRLARRAVNWEYVHHPAIIDEGLETERAFAPDVWDLPALKAMRAELKESDPFERIWWAQLMGMPQVIGGNKFGPPARYASLPAGPYRTIMGCDLAFSKSARADWFSACVLRLYGRRAYLVRLIRDRLEIPMIVSHLRAMHTQYGWAPIWTYVSGPEIGTVKHLIERGLPAQPMPARYNKLVRAQRTMKRWNDGDIVIPEDTADPVIPGFLQRVSLFRGHDDDEDDEIDGIVSACDGGMGGLVAGGASLLGRQGLHLL